MTTVIYIFAGIGVLVTAYAIYGLISWLRGGMDTEAYIAMCREFGRPKCVESADVLPAHAQQHDGGQKP